MPEWLTGLSQEDYRFIKRFLLASGSLKELAKEYSISYPTVRLRLNRLIEKVKTLDSGPDESPFHRRIRLLVADGRLEHSVARLILQEHDAGVRQKIQNTDAPEPGEGPEG